MKKSIPLKEIVGFLPYGLQMKSKNDFVSPLYRKLTVDGFQFHMDNRIPCVRPLSDLTKEITHNGETFVPLKYLHQEVFNCEWPEFEIDFQTLDLMVNCPEEFYISFQDIKRMLEKLHEWHFDIYDWIKDGLAVSINDL